MKKLIGTHTRALAVLTALALAAGAVLVAAGTPAAGAAKKPSIVWLEQGAGNPYWDAQHKAAAEAGKKFGYTFRSVSANLSSSTQAAILRQLVDQKPSAIILNAINPGAMTPSLQYAKQKGVPVLSIYASIPLATTSVTFDEDRSGRIDAQYALNLLKQRYGKASGTIAVLEGVLGQPASDLRANGFINFMKKYPGVTIVATQPTNWAADKASAAMQDWLVKYPALSMVYGLSDTISVPATNVAQRQNRLCTQQSNWTKKPNCIAFVSVDGIFLSDVVSGRLFSTELYSPQWTGFVTGKVAYHLAVHQPVPKVKILKSLLVTPRNAACVFKMQNDMATKTATFPFNAGPSLQAIASSKYHCAIVDAGM